MQTISFTRHRFSPDVIRHAVWLYAPFTNPPPEPFLLVQGVTTAETAKWWASTRTDITTGPIGPRAHFGALQADLARQLVHFKIKPEGRRIGDKTPKGYKINQFGDTF
jgi:hypothetical protein